jgi:hypothetical protein
MFYCKEIFFLCTLPWYVSDTPSTRHQMQESGQFHVSVSVPLEMPNPVPIKEEDAWVRGLVWTMLRRNFFSPLPEYELVSLVFVARSLVNRPASTTLFWLILLHIWRPWKCVRLKVVRQKTVKKFLDVVLRRLAARYKETLRNHCLFHQGLLMNNYGLFLTPCGNLGKQLFRWGCQNCSQSLRFVGTSNILY